MNLMVTIPLTMTIYNRVQLRCRLTMIEPGKLHSSRIEFIKTLLPFELQHASVLSSIQNSLAEDLTNEGNLEAFVEHPADGDVTSRATISADSALRGHIRSKASGVVAGLPIAEVAFFSVDKELEFTYHSQDGEHVESGTVLAEVIGPGRSLLAGERTALNYLGRMSGIASLTHMYVDAVRGTEAVILDTRKTAPGLRYLDKYAVRMGGGHNHRIGLFDMVLIKDNHISGAGGITLAVERVRALYGKRYLIEVEVKNLDELEEAIRLNVDRIMLDNMDLETLRIAVRVTNRRVPLEASGKVTLDNVRQIAETGVDFISSGALTHSAPTLDISMKIG